MIELRASAMPLAFRCAGSVQRSALPIREETEPASLGTATHEALRALAERGAVDWDSLPAIAAKHGVSLDDLRMLCAMATKLWPRIAESFPEALTEVELSHTIAETIYLTGHVDLLTLGETYARAGDWKTGRKDADYSEQMRAYGTLVMLDNPDVDEVTVTVIWLRDGEIENYTLTRDAMRVWTKRLVDDVAMWDGTYHPGPHCPHCPRSHECEAANAMVRRDVSAIADKSLVVRAESELALMSPAEIISLYQKAAMVETYAGRVKDAIKAHVASHGDIVADGTRLTLETENRRELDAIKAWPVLEAAGFGDEDFAACMDLRVSRVEKRVAEKAGKGRGAAAVRKLKDALAEADAIDTREITKLRVKRA